MTYYLRILRRKVNLGQFMAKKNFSLSSILATFAFMSVFFYFSLVFLSVNLSVLLCPSLRYANLYYYLSAGLSIRGLFEFCHEITAVVSPASQSTMIVSPANHL